MHFSLEYSRRYSNDRKAVYRRNRTANMEDGNEHIICFSEDNNGTSIEHVEVNALDGSIAYGALVNLRERMSRVIQWKTAELDQSSHYVYFLGVIAISYRTVARNAVLTLSEDT